MTLHERRELVEGYLGKAVKIVIDRPIGYIHTKGEKTQSFKHKICPRPSKIHMTTKPHTRYRHNFVPIYQKKRKKNCNMAKNGIYS